MRVILTKGEADKVAEIKPKGEKLLFRYIRSILENNVNNPGIIDVKYNDFIGTIRRNGDAVLPLANIESQELKIAGAAVIKEDY